MTVTAQHAVHSVQMKGSGQHSMLKINRRPGDLQQSDKQELHTVTWPAPALPFHRKRVTEGHNIRTKEEEEEEEEKGAAQKKKPQHGRRDKAINGYGVREE